MKGVFTFLKKGPESIMLCVWVAVVALMPFFKPAVSIAMGGLVFLSLWRLFVRPQLLDIGSVGRPFHVVMGIYILFLLWLFASVFWSTDAWEGWRKLTRLDELLILPLIAFASRDLLYKYREILFRALVWGCTLAGVITLYFFFFPDRIPIGDDYYYLLKELSESRDYAHFGAYSPFLDRLYFGYLTAAVLLGFALKAFFGEKLKMYGWTLLILLPLFYVLGARGAQLALLLALWILFTFWTYKFFSGSDGRLSRIRTLIFWIGNVVLCGSIFLVFLFTSDRFAQLKYELEGYRSHPEQFEQMVFHSSVLRWVSWEHNVKLIAQEPVFGVGIGDYHRAMEESYLRENTDLPIHTNQQFLYFGVIAGIPAFLLFVIFFFFSAYLLVRHSDKKPLRMAALCWWSFMFVVMVLDSPLNYTMPAFLFLLIWFSLFFQLPDKRISTAD